MEQDVSEVVLDACEPADFYRAVTEQEAKKILERAELMELLEARA